MAACHATLDGCVAVAGADLPACSDAFKACVHEAMGKAFDALCAKAAASCGSDCSGVLDACANGIPEH